MIKIILFSFMIVVFMISCKYNDYTYVYDVKVTYTNGDVDTVQCSMDSFKGNVVYLKLKISDSGVFSNSSTSPCLVIICGFYTDVKACGVRKYIILNEEKIGPI